MQSYLKVYWAIRITYLFERCNLENFLIFYSSKTLRFEQRDIFSMKNYSFQTVFKTCLFCNDIQASDHLFSHLYWCAPGVKRSCYSTSEIISACSQFCVPSSTRTTKSLHSSLQVEKIHEKSVLGNVHPKDHNSLFQWLCAVRAAQRSLHSLLSISRMIESNNNF